MPTVLETMLADRPSALWPLWERSSGSARDLLRANNATYFGTLASLGVPGPFGFAKGFGTDGSVDNARTGLAASLLFGTTGSFEVMFRTTMTTFGNIAVLRDDTGLGDGEGPSFGVNPSASGELRVRWTSVGGGSASIVHAGNWNDGRWHHAAFTCEKDTGLKVLYIDGAQRGTSTAARGTTATSMRMVTGGNWNGSAIFQQFAGDQALVAFYPTALSPAAVLARWRALRGIAAPSGRQRRR